MRFGGLVPIMAVNSAVLATQCSLAQGNWTTSKDDFIGKGAQKSKASSLA
jgi:hypothetical protein